MDEIKDFIKEKRNVINILVLAILVLALPLGVKLAQNTQILRSRAAGDPIQFIGGNIINLDGGKKAFKLNSDGKAIVGLNLVSQMGAPRGAALHTSVESSKMMSIAKINLVGNVHAEEQCEYSEADGDFSAGCYRYLGGDPESHDSWEEGCTDGSDPRCNGGDTSTSDTTDDGNETDGSVGVGAPESSCSDPNSDFYFAGCNTNECGREIWRCNSDSSNVLNNNDNPLNPNGNCGQPENNPACSEDSADTVFNAFDYEGAICDNPQQSCEGKNGVQGTYVCAPGSTGITQNGQCVVDEDSSLCVCNTGANNCLVEAQGNVEWGSEICSDPGNYGAGSRCDPGNVTARADGCVGGAGGASSDDNATGGTGDSCADGGFTKCYQAEAQCNPGLADAVCADPNNYGEGATCDPFHTGPNGDGCIKPGQDAADTTTSAGGVPSVTHLEVLSRGFLPAVDSTKCALRQRGPGWYTNSDSTIFDACATPHEIANQADYKKVVIEVKVNEATKYLDIYLSEGLGLPGYNDMPSEGLKTVPGSNPLIKFDPDANNIPQSVSASSVTGVKKYIIHHGPPSADNKYTYLIPAKSAIQQGTYFVMADAHTTTHPWTGDDLGCFAAGHLYKAGEGGNLVLNRSDAVHNGECKNDSYPQYTPPNNGAIPDPYGSSIDSAGNVNTTIYSSERPYEKKVVQIASNIGGGPVINCLLPPGITSISDYLTKFGDQPGKDGYCLPRAGTTVPANPTAGVPGPGGPTAGGPGGGPATSTRPGTSTPPTVAQPTTDFYRFAETPAALATKAFVPYSEPLITNIEFSDKTPGLKFVYAEFKDSNGKVGGCGANLSQYCVAQIELLKTDPIITGCGYDSSGNFTIKGNNFGASGKLQSNSGSLTASSWSETIINATGTVPTTNSTIQLTRADGLVATGICTSSSGTDLAIIGVGAKLFCPQVAPHEVTGAKLTIDGAGNRTDETVSIDSTGLIKGSQRKLDVGKQYKVGIKVPRGVRQVASITAFAGTTNINFTLALGDIFPIQTGDGAINSVDKSELNKEWAVSVAQSQAGDFNTDLRVNSVDWACMVHDFGKVDETL
jgi:hypothetical protein